MINISIFPLILFVSAIIFFIIREIRKDIFKKDINKVADMILSYQNNKIKDVKEIIQCLEKENKKNKSWFDWASNLPDLQKDPSKYFFYLPDDMRITEENNEIVIYYKKLVYNVNRGKYMDVSSTSNFLF